MKWFVFFFEMRLVELHRTLIFSDTHNRICPHRAVIGELHVRGMAATGILCICIVPPTKRFLKSFNVGYRSTYTRGNYIIGDGTYNLHKILLKLHTVCLVMPLDQGLLYENHVAALGMSASTF